MLNPRKIARETDIPGRMDKSIKGLVKARMSILRGFC
jgi:hypothetical protein